jgi:high-affinity nickel-transport protein
VYYNITITGLSVMVAFFIGTVELFGLLGQEAHLHGWIWDQLGSFNINKAGVYMVGIFVVVWVIALSIWRFGHIEARWDRSAEA